VTRASELGEPPERQAKLLSHVSREVAKVRPDLKLEAIAYSKLIEPPKTEKIDKSVLIDFCPIAQNFEFTLDDPPVMALRDGATPVANKQYFDALRTGASGSRGRSAFTRTTDATRGTRCRSMSPWHMSQR
jgi:hypothetical protein